MDSLFFLVGLSVFTGIVLWLVVSDLFYERKLTKPEIRYEQRKEKIMADLLTYTLTAAPVVDKDVVTRSLTVSVDGVSEEPRVYSADVVDFGTVTVPQDSNVVLTLVDTDDAGNSSVPAVVAFVAADTIAPAQPGAVVVTLVGENVDESK